MVKNIGRKLSLAEWVLVSSKIYLYLNGGWHKKIKKLFFALKSLFAMASSWKKYRRIFETFEHSRIHSLFQGVFLILQSSSC